MHLKLNKTSALQTYQLIRFTAMFTISIAMVKMSLPQGQIGQYEMLLFITNLLSTFWITGMVQALLPLYNQYKINAPREKDSILFNAFLLIVALAVLSGVIAIFAKKFLLKIEGVSELSFFNLVIVYLVLSTPSLLIEYIYLLKDKPRQMISYGVISQLLQILLVISPLFIKLKIEYSVYGLIAISAVRLVWLLVLIKKHSNIKVDIDFLKIHLKQGFPLALKYLISSSGTYIDQIIITTQFDSATFALYRFGAREIPLITLMTVGLSNSLLSEFGDTQSLKSTLTQLKKESLKLMHLLFPISIIGIMLSKPLFPLVFSPDFTNSANIFIIYALLIISRSVYPQTVTMGLQHNSVVLLAATIEMGLNIVLSLILVKPMGIEGVALATVIVYAAEKIFLFLYNYFKLKISPQLYTPLKPFAIYSLLTIIAFFIAKLI